MGCCMTNTEYAQYEQAVADFLSRNKVRHGCYGPKYQEERGEPWEPFFSWSPCECCQSSLGGNRETYMFVTHWDGPLPHTPGERETFEADICTDCVYYLTYGKLDDQTMDEIAKGGAQ